MRVIICDLTGQLPRGRRQELETRLVALAGAMPVIDSAELDLETSPGASAAPSKRVSVTLRANHRRVMRITEEGPTLTAALERALSDTARKSDALGPGATRKAETAHTSGLPAAR